MEYKWNTNMLFSQILYKNMSKSNNFLKFSFTSSTKGENNNCSKNMNNHQKTNENLPKKFQFNNSNLLIRKPIIKYDMYDVVPIEMAHGYSEYEYWKIKGVKEKRKTKVKQEPNLDFCVIEPMQHSPMPINIIDEQFITNDENKVEQLRLSAYDQFSVPFDNCCIITPNFTQSVVLHSPPPGEEKKCKEEIFEAAEKFFAEKFEEEKIEEEEFEAAEKIDAEKIEAAEKYFAEKFEEEKSETAEKLNAEKCVDKAAAEETDETGETDEEIIKEVEVEKVVEDKALLTQMANVAADYNILANHDEEDDKDKNNKMNFSMIFDKGGIHAKSKAPVLFVDFGNKKLFYDAETMENGNVDLKKKEFDNLICKPKGEMIVHLILNVYSNNDNQDKDYLAVGIKKFAFENIQPDDDNVNNNNNNNDDDDDDDVS